MLAGRMLRHRSCEIGEWKQGEEDRLWVCHERMRSRNERWEMEKNRLLARNKTPRCLAKGKRWAVFVSRTSVTKAGRVDEQSQVNK